MPIREAFETVGQLIELMGAAIILIGLVHATISYLIRVRRRAVSAYDRYKVSIGKTLLLGLEFLVAADVIDSVLLESTVESVAVLGLLVLIRTFLGWSVLLEIEGRWPWQAAAAERQS